MLPKTRQLLAKSDDVFYLLLEKALLKHQKAEPSPANLFAQPLSLSGTLHTLCASIRSCFS